jgi:tripartite-type tricarboxylate transporter receptor subunit TctC
MKLRSRRQFLHLAAGGAAVPAVSRIARAQAYPTRPITMVVGFPAGGPADVIARIMVERMPASLGQPVIVENVAGAAGSIGAGRVARSAADGYTINLGSFGTHVLNGALYTLSYDLLNDLDPVSLLVTQPAVIVGRKTLPAKDMNELIAWLKLNPDKASEGTNGVGVAGVLFQNTTGTRFQQVPYRGIGLAMQDLAAGHIDVVMGVVSGDALPHIRAGSVKAYAVMDKTRLAAAPDIPTVDELGLRGLHLTFWFGLWAPKRTPKNIVAALNSAAVEALAASSVRARFAAMGQEIFPRDQQTPEALAAFHKAEIEKWWPIIKAANIKAE